jgi:hypothetical protein
VAAFEAASGVGVTVTAEQIAEAVGQVIKNNEAELKEKRYRFNVGILLAHARKALPVCGPRLGLWTKRTKTR